MKIFTFFVAFFLPYTAIAQVAAVIDIFSDPVIVYEKHDGGPVKKKLSKSEIKLPAAQLSKPSKVGLIMVEFRLKGDSEKPLIGWVRRRSVKVDKLLKVDLSPCAKSLSRTVVVKRSTRALGEGC
ncbi:MAG: hypothetical protein ACKVKG_07665 [Alphaproteobacteria bacterium]